MMRTPRPRLSPTALLPKPHTQTNASLSSVRRSPYDARRTHSYHQPPKHPSKYFNSPYGHTTSDGPENAGYASGERECWVDVVIYSVSLPSPLFPLFSQLPASSLPSIAFRRLPLAPPSASSPPMASSTHSSSTVFLSCVHCH